MTHGDLYFRNKDYKDIVDPLAKYTQKLNNEKAFIFIDPYGYKEIRASEIKKLLTSKKAVHGFIHQFKEALRKYLANDFFVDTFTIQKDATTVFCLFFFSSHIRGFEKMLETKWQIDEDEGKGWSYEKTGNLFLALKTNPLEQKLLDFIKNNNKCFNGDVYEYCLRLGFLPVHCNEVFTSLQTEGRLEVGSDSLENIRKGAFYINYESYKREPNKVYFKIK